MSTELTQEKEMEMQHKYKVIIEEGSKMYRTEICDSVEQAWELVCNSRISYEEFKQNLEKYKFTLTHTAQEVERDDL